MFTPIEAFLGWRYTRAKRRSHFVSFISATAMLGVALGVAALITILSIMNGFESELRDRILGMAAHVVVTADNGPLKHWRKFADSADLHPGVVGSAPYIRREAMLTHYENAHGAVIRGIEPVSELNVSVIANKVGVEDLSSLQSGSFSVILGRGLAEALQARIGDSITIISPEPVRTPVGAIPRLRRFKVVGIFEAGVHEYDTSMALVHIEDAAKMFRYQDAVTGVRIKISEPFNAPRTAVELNYRLSAVTKTTIEVVDWTETNVNLFRALKTEKIVMFVMLALTIAVAAFNLIATLVMVVSEKRSEIAILQTLGMTKKSILVVFFCHGGLIGVVGIVAGTVIGVLLAINIDVIIGSIEQVLRFKILSPDIYYISEIPSELKPHDVAVAVLVAAVLCLLAPLYPALLASRTAPARALRYD